MKNLINYDVLPNSQVMDIKTKSNTRDCNLLIERLERNHCRIQTGIWVHSV